MATNDNWLREIALQRKARAAEANLLKGPAPMDGRAVGALWLQLQQEIARQATVFGEALGDPGAVIVETPPDEIRIKTDDGRVLTIHVDRERAELTETFVNRGGGLRRGKPTLRFRIDPSGQVAFNFLDVHAAGGSILRRML